jgi:hypothetical protein
MRLFSVLPVLGLLLGTHALMDWREPALDSFDVRSPDDVCVSLNTELVVPDILGILTAVGVISESIFPSSPTCQSIIVPVFLTRINRPMPLSVGYSFVHRDERRRHPGHYHCRRRCGNKYFDGPGVWSTIQSMIWECVLTLVFSPRLTVRPPN